MPGAVFFSGTGEKLQSDNFTQELKDAGLAAPTPLTKVYDLNGAFGGPIKKDRVWYFVNARTQGSTRTIANIFYNQNAGDPTKWTVRAGSEPAGLHRPHLGERERARHLAGDAAQQDRRLLGRAADLPEVHGDDAGHHRSGAGLARGDRRRSHEPDARAAGDLVVARDEPAAAGRRVRRHVLRLGQPRADRKPHARSHSRHRTVREPAAPPTATSRAWCTARRTGATTSAARTTGGHRPRTSPARTA